MLLVSLLFFGTAIAQETEIVTPPPPPVLEENVVVKAEIVDFPDVEAQFPEGTRALQVFIRENCQYPIDAIEKNIQGRVYLSFIVESDGSISGVKVMRGVSPSIDSEAKRLIKKMPNWTPAEINGSKVRSSCRLPINFTLSNTGKEEAPEKKH